MVKRAKSLTRSQAMKESWAKRRKSPMREQARKRTVKADPKPQGDPKFYILWAPSSNKPPRIRFGTVEKVRAVADIMVQKYLMPIYVMESVELHKLGKSEVVKCDGPAVKEQPSPAPESFTVSASSIPSRQGQPWDQIQDNYLTELWYQGIRSIPELARLLGRSELAIEYRLEALMIRSRSE
jgi:hypothetical protein